MGSIHPEKLPEGALLVPYRDSGAYTDCYVIDLDRPVTQQAFVEAFYTGWLFKVERFILHWVVAKPSTDAEAKALAAGQRDQFAAWSVEARTLDQLLMCDYQNRTRSWLMALPTPTGTRLHFGTAVVPLRPNGDKDRAFGAVFQILLGFHRLYARALLWTAVRNVKG